jgi:hypothetical protein
MPIETRLDAAHDVFVHVVTGIPTLAEVQSAAQARAGCGDGGAASGVLWDLRGLDAARYGVPQMRPLLAAVRSRRERGEPAPRVALLAPSDLIYGVARMYASYAESDFPAVAVFRSEAEALAWLRPAAASP